MFMSNTTRKNKENMMKSPLLHEVLTDIRCSRMEDLDKPNPNMCLS